MMLPAGAFAVVLILGGAQIMLPAPAFVEQGRVWAPAREVLQRLGYKVRWQADPRALVASREQQDLSFPELPPPWPVPSTPDQARYARRQGSVLYLPLLALRGLGVRATWEPGARRVVIRDLAPVATPLAAVLHDPTQWLGHPVVLTGVYAGWDSSPLCYATRAGPPVAGGGWVLRSEDGAIFCTPDPQQAPARTGLASAQVAAPLLTPYAVIGQRVSVTGTVALAASGVPFLRHGHVELIAGRAGVSCTLVLDALACRPGERLSWELVIHNPGPSDLTLPAGSYVTLSVAAPQAQLYVQKQSYGTLTSATVVAPQAEVRFPGSFSVPIDAPAGTYSITLGVEPGFRTYAERFEVVSARGADLR